MKKFLKKLGFHDPDEMERAILFKAQRNSYVFLMLALLAWSLYESWKVYTEHGRINMLPCFLLVTAAGIQSLSQLIMTHNAVKDDEDSYETGPIIRIALLICVAFSIIATVTAAIILLGARV